MSTSNLAAQYKIAVPEKIDLQQIVVVVEDQQDMRLIISHHLNKLGFKNLQTCNNGYDAMEFLTTNKKKISVILSSTDMPFLDGFQLLNEIRENPNIERPPFVLTMGNASRERIMMALENGADEIIVKPFTLNDLMPKIQAAFKTFHNPKNPEKVYELAKQKFREGQLDEAEQIYKTIAQATEKSARPWVGLARIEGKRQKFDKALEYLAEGEKKNSNFVHVYSLRGEILRDQKKYEDCITAYRKAIELSPLNPLRYDDAAKPLFALKRYEDAIAILGIAVKNGLSFPSLHRFLSEAYYATKDFKLAVRHIKTALYNEPENVLFLNQLGISLKELGEHDEAMKTYNQIIKLDQENRAAYFNKAILLAAKSNYDEAVKTLQRTVKKFPDFAIAAAKLAEFEKALAQQEQNKKAATPPPPAPPKAS